MASADSCDDEDARWSIAKLLSNIGLGQYAKAFVDNMIDIQHVDLMTEEDFSHLGISTMGVRLKVKQACRNYVKGTESPVVRKFVELESKKRKHGISNARRNLAMNEKPTRKIYVGWKHSTTDANHSYVIVRTNNGGGQQIIDVPKETTYNELVEIICNIYFPQQISNTKGLQLGSLDFFIASFNGTPISNNIDGCDFTVGKYFRQIKSTPVRMYLHTSEKGLQDKPGGDIGMHIDELWPQRFEEGYTLPSTKITRENVPEIVQAMVAHHVIQPQKMALDQFVQGLQIGGVFQALQEHTTEAMGLFRGGATSLTMDYLENLVIFDYSNIDEGSNAATVAQGIEQGWVLLLQAAESGEAKFQFEETAQNISLADLLQWFTGATRIPAVGFRKKIDIYFDKDACLPKVNTCSMDAYFPLLPVFQDPERFMRQLVEWVVCSRGFGLL